MTDDQRHRLDVELRAEYEQTKADRSRFRQRAKKHGESLQHLGSGLQTQPERLSIWKSEAKDEWRWTYSPNGFHVDERGLPEWKEVREIATEIGRLGAEMERLEQELRERKLL
jgi:hypothetical protein